MAHIMQGEWLTVPVVEREATQGTPKPQVASLSWTDPAWWSAGVKLCEDAGAAVHLVDRGPGAQGIVDACVAEAAFRERSSTIEQ
jgi:hypothetical protein